jgi:hypothetical protein
MRYPRGGISFPPEIRSALPHASNIGNKICLPAKGRSSTRNLTAELHARIVRNEIGFGYFREENNFPPEICQAVSLFRVGLIMNEIFEIPKKRTVI